MAQPRSPQGRRLPNLAPSSCQAGWHTSLALEVPDNITLMPPRALNPIETVWQVMHDNWLSNRVFKNYDGTLDHCCLEQSRLTAHRLNRNPKRSQWVLSRRQWYQPSPGQDPPCGVRPVREPAGSRAEMFDFLGFTPYCTTTRKGRLVANRSTKRVNKTLVRIDEVLRKHHDIWEVGMCWVYQGWLNYVAVPGAVDQSGPPQAATPVDESAAVPESPLRLERMSAILWPRASIRHPWPDQRFAVNHPK